MIYTKSHPALLIMGVLFVAIAYLADSGSMGGMMDYLKIGKYAGEMIGMGYAFGVVGVLVGAWHMWGRHSKGNLALLICIG